MPPKKDQTAELQLLDNLLDTKSDRAWNAFYRRYERLMIGCVRKVLERYRVPCTPEDIEDLINSACLQLVRDDFAKLRRYDRARGYRLSSWVGLIATNTAHDALRRRGPPMYCIDDEEAGVLDRPSEEISPIDRAALREKEDVLNQAVAQMTTGEQLFLRYYYGEHRTPEEIAGLLNISVNTVYSRKNKIRNALKRIVQDMQTGAPLGDKPT